MSTFRWLLALSLLLAAMALGGLSGSDRAWLLAAGFLVAFGAEIAHRLEVARETLRRRWEARGHQRRHDEIITKLDSAIESVDPSPHLTLLWHRVNWFSPDVLELHVSVDNPGKPTVLRNWTMEISPARAPNVVLATFESAWWSDTVERRSADGKPLPTPSFSQAPMPQGWTGVVTLSFRFQRPIIRFEFDDTTRFLLACGTTAGARLEARWAGAPALPPPQQPFGPGHWDHIDRELGLPPDASRKPADRLAEARRHFVDLLDLATSGGAEPKTRLLSAGKRFLRISNESNAGDYRAFVEDYEFVREVERGAGIR